MQEPEMDKISNDDKEGIDDEQRDEHPKNIENVLLNDDSTQATIFVDPNDKSFFAAVNALRHVKFLTFGGACDGTLELAELPLQNSVSETQETLNGTEWKNDSIAIQVSY